MIYDSFVNSSIPTASKDFTKKKRANRSTKLKQCKLDARRQQWLSQVNNKCPKAEGSGNGSNNRESNGPIVEARKGKTKGKGKGQEPCCKGVEVKNVCVEQIHIHDSDSEESSLANSPTRSVIDSRNNYPGSSGSSSSSTSSSASSLSFGSGGCCSGSITEEEEGRGGEFGNDDGCLDDWETVADALVACETNDEQGLDDDHSRDKEVDAQEEKGKSDNVGILGRVIENSRAWRPDDASRPQSLPILSKHQSFPAKSERLSVRGSNPMPITCPICCEDLDFTDASFLPCPCGFHLCLFCHNRITEEDARCPGCRKPYSSEAVGKDTSVSGGSLTIRLSRSSSMSSRV